ncbi:MAG: endonuclease/exonuclease/phosphatase family protein [Pseudomonadota bacterium]
MSQIMSRIRSRLAGAFTLAALLCIGASFARLVPSGHLLGPLARILDSFAPWFVILAMGLGIVTYLLGARRMAMVLYLLAMGHGGVMLVDHRAVSQPLAPGQLPELRVAFLNAQSDSHPQAATEILAQVARYNPDIAVFAEASALWPARRALGGAYRFVSPCPAPPCELMIAAQDTPLRHWTLPLNAIWDDRYGVLEAQTGQGTTFFLSVAHLTKPWFSGIAEGEVAQLIAQYRWFEEEAPRAPVIAVGDFNMAPWARHMEQILTESGLRTLRAPVTTWPQDAVMLRLPIDQVLVSPGVHVTAVETFSTPANHLGLIVDIAFD